MSTLAETLTSIREAFGAKVPAEAKATMSAATNELRASGIMDRIPHVGSTLPAFELPDSTGQPVRSAELLDKGPLVVSFYRGGW